MLVAELAVARLGDFNHDILEGFAGQHARDIRRHRAVAHGAHGFAHAAAQRLQAGQVELAFVGQVQESVDFVGVDIGDHGRQGVGDGATQADWH